MQKKVRRPMSPLSETSVTTAVISSDSKRAGSADAPAISNDNSKQDGPAMSKSAGSEARPKVFMSPKKAAAKNEVAKKKPVRFSTEFSAHSSSPAAEKISAKTALSASSELKMPLLSAPKDAPESQDIAPDDLAPVITREPVKNGSLFFDLKFALGLIGIVVAVNLLLAMLVDKAENKTPMVASVPAKAAPVAAAPAPQPAKVASVPAAPAPAPQALKPLPVAAPVAATPVEAPQGAIVTNSSLPDIQPSAGVAMPAAAPAPQAKPQPSLGVVTSAADEKAAAAAPRRNLLSIIDQSN